MSWPKVKLSDVSADINYGVTASASESPVGPKFLRITDIQDNQVNWNAVPYCDGPPKQLKNARLAAGDIVFARTGATTGKSFLVRECPDDAVYASYLIRLRPNHRVDPSFLSHFFATPNYWSQISSAANGAAQPGVNASKLRNLEIPLPPLDEQKRIAAILDQADDLRRLRARALEKLNKLGQTIFHEMFGSDSSQWDQINLTEFVKDVSDIKCGPFGTQLLKDEFTSHGIPLWGIKQVNQNFTLPTYEFISDEKFKSLAMYSIEPDDIIMTRKGTVGNCAVYPKHFPKGVMHSDLLRIRVDSDRHNAIFLADQFKYSGDFMRQLALISGGAVMPGINVGKLKALKAIAPPKQAQDAYASRICVLNQQHLRTLLFSKKSEALFASLQSAAFQGKL